MGGLERSESSKGSDRPKKDDSLETDDAPAKRNTRKHLSQLKNRQRIQEAADATGITLSNIEVPKGTGIFKYTVIGDEEQKKAFWAEVAKKPRTPETPTGPSPKRPPWQARKGPQ